MVCIDYHADDAVATGYARADRVENRRRGQYAVTPMNGVALHSLADKNGRDRWLDIQTQLNDTVATVCGYERRLIGACLAIDLAAEIIVTALAYRLDNL